MPVSWLLRARLEFHDIIADYCSYLETQIYGRSVTDTEKSNERF